MRNLLILGAVTLGLAGCVLDTGEVTDSDEETGEAQAAASSFTSSFKFHKHYAGVSKFPVPAHATVAVTAHATWSIPGKCKLPAFKIELVEAGMFGSVGPRDYSMSGAGSTQKWTDVGAGVYHLVFDSNNDNNDCELAGSVSVNITP